MKNILVLSNVNNLSAAYRYRIQYPLEELADIAIYTEINFYSKFTYLKLKSNSFFVIIFVIFDLIKTIFRLILLKKARFDVLIVKNYLFPLFGKSVEHFVFRFVKFNKIIYDIDDAIYFNTKTQRNRYFRNFRDPKSKVLFWTSLADRVITSNNLIQEDIIRLNPMLKRINCISILSLIRENEYFNHSEEVVKNKEQLKCVFVWLGSSHTQENILLWRDFILKISFDPNNEIHFIGTNCKIPEFVCSKNIFFHRWSKKIENKILRKSHFGLNPLFNNKFESRKSAFKVIQYYRSGIIPIVSDVGINSDLVHKYGGHVYEGHKSATEFYRKNYDLEINRLIFKKTRELSIESAISTYKEIL